MELKKGYKQTEAGIIPEDWDIIRLGDIFEFKNGLNKEKQFFGEGTPIVNYMDVYRNRGLSSKDLLGRVTLSHQEIKCFEVKKGDVFFTRTSETVEEVGISSVMLDDVKNTVFSGFVLRARPKNNRLEINFNKYCFSTQEARKQITSKSSYTTRALTNGRFLSDVKVIIPKSCLEQAAIATALSNTDELIASLEKLIAKKQAIKQGTMKQLLNGQKRMPGYQNKPSFKQTEVGIIPSDWEVKKLGRIAHVATGNTPPTRDVSNYGEDFFFVSPADLGKGKYIIDTERKLSKNGFDISRKFPANSILFTCIGSTIGKSGIAPIELTSNQQINAIFPNDSFSSDYLFYSLNLLAPRIKSLAGEQAVPIINKTNFEETLIPFPPTKAEQTAIAQVLSDMDAEMEALEKKRDKYKAVKQGMMQELLTGKTRLV